MIPVLLILFPLISGLLSFFIKDEKTSKIWASLSSLATLVVAIIAACCSKSVSFDAAWIPTLGSRFSLGYGWHG